MRQQRKLTRKEKNAQIKQGVAIAGSGKKQSISGNAISLKFLLGLMCAAFGFLLYLQTISYEYTLDDDAVIQNNYIVHKGVNGIGTLLQTSYLSGSNSGQDVLYRPLSLIMFAIEWQISPDSPALSHLVNVLLFAITGFLLFNLLCKLFNRNLVFSFAATLLFMAHPVHTEVVANIKSRDEILSFLFCIISISCLVDYLQSNKTRTLILLSFSFFLALLSKESAVTLLAVVPLLLFTCKNTSLRKTISLVVPFLIATFVYFLIRFSVLNGILDNGKISVLDNILVSAADFSSRLATEIYVLGRYMLLLIFPLNLSNDYSFASIKLLEITDYRVLISLLSLLLITGYAIFSIRRKDTIAVAILYFLLTISVASNMVITIGTVMGERLLYAPSLAICIVITTLLVRIFKNGQTEPNDGIAEQNVMDFFSRHARLFIVLGFIVALYSFKTLNRNQVWKNNYSLAQAGVQDAPNSSRAHYFLGGELVHVVAKNETDSAKRHALYEQALEELTKAVTIAPQNSAVYTDIGLTYFAMKDTVNAIKYYDIALVHDKFDKRAMNNKGILLVKKDNKEAMSLFTEAVRIDPHYADALKNLGNLYGFLGDLDNAMVYFERSIPYQNDKAALAETYRFMGMISDHRRDKVKTEYYNAKARENAGQ
ncbi:MAG: DUF1736 domain-containing protein [Chitinophagaceae bacterium]|nr:DUF1736 domain-containing protein [Chitinophagaceae bacterium]